MSARKIFYNTILQSVGKFISILLGLVTIAYLTPYLGASGFGEYTTVVAFMGFVGILADLGLYLVTTREISVEGADERKILSNIFSLRFITVVLMLTAGALVAMFFPYSAAVKRAMFVGILAFSFVSGTQVLVGVFQKHLVFYQLVASEIVQRLILLGTTLLFISWKSDLIYFIWSLALANAAHFFISTVLARRFIPFSLQFDFVFWKNILAKSWPLAFSVVLNLIYFKADTLILSVFKPSQDVGLYGLSYKFLEVLLSFPAMFAGLIMPFLARYAFGEWDKYRLYMQKSFDAILLVIVPMVVSVVFFARPIVNLVGGQIYPDADKVLQILIFATAIIYLGNLIGYNVVALNSQKKMVWGYLLGTIVGLTLYFILIPAYSYFGAAAATVAVEATVATYGYFLTSRVSGYFPTFNILLKAFVAAIPMGLFFHYIKFSWADILMPAKFAYVTNWVSETLIGLAIYLIILLVVRAIPKDFVKEILKRSSSEPSPSLVHE